jgi:drug/metabolite transporter (DMT)-like permease
MIAQPQENRVAGILWMLLTMFCFLALDTVMKHLLQSYSLVQVTWARFFFATIVAGLACGRSLPVLARSLAPVLQLGRSFFLLLTTGTFNAGITTVPLATATSIMFTSPILITVLSIPILGEHVGWRRWAGVLCGFAGALIIVRPWSSGALAIGAGTLLLLVAALLNANYQILTRKVRVYDHPLTSLLYTAAAGAVITRFIVPWFWQWPTAFDWLLFVGSGCLGGLGHLFLIQAFRRAPASVVAPFSYSALLWATLFGWIVFGEWPDSWTWVGAAIIVASGLYIFHREQRAHPAEAAEPQTSKSFGSSASVVPTTVNTWPPLKVNTTLPPTWSAKPSAWLAVAKP